jgi:glycine/D-amino acid oxidase-like deaminating enzyme
LPGLTGMVVHTPFWWEDAAPPDIPGAPLPGKCDVAIVGAGYAGLSAALELVRKGRSVQVFDKGTAGGAASSRSAGITSGNLRIPFDRMISALGLERARAYYSEGIEARDDLARFIREEKIDCRFQAAGRYTAATRPDHYEHLAREVEALNRHFDLGAWAVPKSEQTAEIGSDLFHGGVVRPDISGVQPALLHRGMLEAALRDGVAVHEHTAVSAIRRKADGFELSTSRGMVSAGDVIVCTNGYTDGAVPWLQRRIVPVASLIITTQPVPKELMDRLCPKRRMFGDTNRIHHYFRPSPDGTRILFGGRASGNLQVDGPVDHEPLRKNMIRIFPDLANVGLSHAWWGYIAMNLDHLPQLANRDGVHYATGFCGSGVVWARWIGRKAAQKILGEPAAASAFENQRFGAIPFYRGNPWFLPATVSWYRLLDRLGL